MIDPQESERRLAAAVTDHAVAFGDVVRKLRKGDFPSEKQWKRFRDTYKPAYDAFVRYTAGGG